MKKSELKNLIKEELTSVLKEYGIDPEFNHSMQKQKTTAPSFNKAQRKHVCHDCLEDFSSKDLYNIDMGGHYVSVFLNCLKDLRPKEWEKIKKEHDVYRETSKTSKY